MQSGAMSTRRMCRGSVAARAGAGDDHRAERIQLVQRAMRRAAHVRFPARHLELAAGLRGDPDLAALSRSSTPAMRSNAFG